MELVESVMLVARETQVQVQARQMRENLERAQVQQAQAWSALGACAAWTERRAEVRGERRALRSMASMCRSR